MSAAVRRGLEEADADGQALLVAGADGDDAGDELLERRAKAPLGQLEHGRLGIAAHGLGDALHDDVDVERLLLVRRGHRRRSSAQIGDPDRSFPMVGDGLPAHTPDA